MGEWLIRTAGSQVECLGTHNEDRPLRRIPSKELHCHPGVSQRVCPIFSPKNYLNCRGLKGLLLLLLMLVLVMTRLQ